MIRRSSTKYIPGLRLGWGSGTRCVEHLPSMQEALGFIPVLHKLVVVVPTCNPSIPEIEAGSEVQGYPGLQGEFEAILEYMKPDSK